MKSAKTLRTHAGDILAWYDYPIRTAQLEGTNNQINTINRQAYGFRKVELGKLETIALRRTGYALLG